jgi:hypothetical protein
LDVETSVEVIFLIFIVFIILYYTRKKKPIRQTEEERIYTKPRPPPPLQRLDEEYQEPRPPPPSLKSEEKQLISMSFRQVGKFILSDGLQLSLTSNIHDSGVYALVIEDEIKYIGKARDLYKRMMEYRDSGANDTNYTNRNVNQNLVSSGQTQILFLPKRVINISAPFQFGIKLEKINYHILEDILIDRYKPPWNYEGRKD